jgi:ribosome biogenesis GTPase A
VKAIADYQNHLAKNDLALKHKVQNWRERLIEMLRDALVARTRERLTDEQVTRYAQEIAEHKRDPYTLVEEIVKSL